jgi:hypothetical protein
MYRINQKVKVIFFVSRILVAVIVNLVVIPSNQQNLSILFSSSCITLCPAGSDRLLLKNHYIQIRCLFWSESQIMRL